MSSKYTATFTPCGYSIRQLRTEAARLKRSEGLKLQEAQDHIAKNLKYSDWRELIGQKADPKRDDFFLGMYNDRKDSSITQELYAEFLKKKKLPANKETYRLFILEHWETFKQCGMTNLDLDNPPLLPSIFIEELTAAIARSGAFGLLPQHLSNRLLETTIWAGRIFDGEIDVPDDIQSGFFQSGLLCISGILAYQTKKGYFEMPVDKLLEHIREYYLYSFLEFTSRRTGFSVILPSIDEMFMPNAQLSMRVPPELWKKAGI